MILYQLACDAAHRFESWFRDSAAYDDQVDLGLLACPVCGSAKVAKSIMAPAVVGQTSRRPPVDVEAAAHVAAPSSGPPVLLDPRHRALRVAMRAVRDKILAEGQDVGTRFPAEARSMHEGEIPVRPIHGHATLDEARSLIEDGIMILPLPVLPEELN